VASPAAAAGDEATAEALFQQAREAMSKGDFAKACGMFEESYRLVPGVGTRFNLADCYERIGRTATAWAEFRDAAAASKLAGQKERANAARERADRLEGKLCRVTIQAGSQSGLTVTRDGDVVGSGQWGVAVPIDPGSHVLEAKAPGMKPWSTTFSIASCPAEKTIAVPELMPQPAPVGPPPPPPPPPLEEPKVAPPQSSTRPILTWASLGLGVAGVAVGSYLGLRAWSLRDESNQNGHCTGNQCDDRGQALRDESRSFGTGATVAFAAGGALLVLGAVLWLTDSTPPKSNPRAQ
jgi:serine/threonine-protein kinase